MLEPCGIIACEGERFDEQFLCLFGVEGHAVIGCSTSPGKYILSQLIGAFRKLYPEVQFSVEVMDRQTR